MSITILSPTITVPSRRPRLSLETSILPVHFGRKSTTSVAIGTECETPTTIRNTYANAFNGPVPKTSYAQQLNESIQQQKPAGAPTPIAELSSLSSSSSESSPLSTYIPYSISIGTRSILRNSPLPRRFATASFTKLKSMFPAVKRVGFHEKLVQFMPALSLEDSELSDSDFSPSSRQSTYDSPTKVAEKQFHDDNEQEETPATPVQGQIRRRNWVWTLGPLERDNTLCDGKDVVEGLELQTQTPQLEKIDETGRPSEFNNRINSPSSIDTKMEDAPLEYAELSDQPGYLVASDVLKPPMSMLHPIICDDT
ncbi:hypothetical protein MMC14_005868 [Varicellaria rhodocarpa]|nr:hypothetical protein [Varicellaria rhodocarpa]